MKKLITDWWFLLRHDKKTQMATLGAFMIGVGFGFLHAIGFMGLILYYKSWE